MRQIPLMNITELDALIHSPPAWLLDLPDVGPVMEAADLRLNALQVGQSISDSLSEQPVSDEPTE